MAVQATNNDQRLPNMIRSKTLMENFRITSSNKDVAVATAGGGRRRSNPNDQTCCKKHPKHRQSPGVCSLCLKQKLSRLSANTSSRCTTSTTTIASSSSSSLSSYCSSSSASSSYSSSPPMPHYEGKVGFSMILVGGEKMLRKSRSVAFVSRFGSKEGKKKNKTGFLSKLIHPRRVH